MRLAEGHGNWGREDIFLFVSGICFLIFEWRGGIQEFQ